METYPVRVEARLEEPLNRGLWLVKWLLAIPHYIVLSLLWTAFAVLTVVAFFAILFTGRYPRTLFDFNLGVLRWTWRVAYYSYGALGTDRYPPFSLGAEPDYPATLDIAYPERLSRGLVLVKWWLLAIPHYLIVGLFTSGSVISWRGDLPDSGGVLYTLDWGGLIGLLVLIAALFLLFAGRYPHGVFDLVIGMNRWALRVAAYATLMTDAYPPFRLEQGGHETPRPEAPRAAHAPVRHGAGSIVAITLGALLAFGAIGTAAAGAGSAVLSQSRDGGFLTTASARVSTSTYALATDQITINEPGATALRTFAGRIRVQTSDPRLFIGIADRTRAASYLDNLAYDQVTRLTPDNADYRRHPGSAPTTPPAAQTFWTVSGQGNIMWDIEPGDWTLVVMNADGSARVTADLTLAATLPGLTGLTTALFITTGVLLIAGFILILVGIRLATAPTDHPRQPAPVP
ncbi:DUF4389 domain-containing protein [Nonomuraea sp. NPDC048892]|uniref:DUF4389 domain-containing protein n=1 Tax=Nonomuraea sp. NPDC048892 TaxID=3154624 RepID=UPI0033F24E86